MRLNKPIPQEIPESYEAADGRISICTDTLDVTIDGRVTHFRPLQVDLLLAHAMSLDQVLTNDELSRRIYCHRQHPTDDPLRMAISGLRKGLGSELGDPNSGALRTKRNMGYLLVRSLRGRFGEYYEDDTEKASLGENRVRIYPTYGLVQVDAKPEESFTAYEFAILAVLAKNPNIILAPSAINERVSDIYNELACPSPENLQVAIFRIRQKLGPQLGDRRKGVISTVKGRGYMGVA